MIINNIGSTYSVKRNQQSFGIVEPPSESFTRLVEDEVLLGNKKAIALWNKGVNRMTVSQENNPYVNIIFKIGYDPTTSTKKPIIGVHLKDNPIAKEEFVPLGNTPYAYGITPGDKIRSLFAAMNKANNYANDITDAVEIANKL